MSSDPLAEYGNLLDSLHDIINELEHDYDMLSHTGGSNINVDYQLGQMKTINGQLTRLMSKFTVEQPGAHVQQVQQPEMHIQQVQQPGAHVQQVQQPDNEKPYVGQFGIKIFGTSYGPGKYEVFTVTSVEPSGKKITVTYPEDTNINYTSSTSVKSNRENFSLRSNGMWGPVGVTGKQFRNYSITFGSEAEQIADQINKDNENPFPR